MILADTTAWIDYFNGASGPHVEVLDFELSRNRIVTGDLIIAEFLQGFRNEREYQEAKKIMETLEYRDLVGRDIAIAAAQNYRFLRKNGVTVRKTIDILIATFCIENGIEIIHNDRDYDGLEEHLGLKVRR